VKIAAPRLIVATHNNGKLAEMRSLLSAYVPDIVSAGQLGLPSPDETGTTFVENSLIKARAAATAAGCLALADDSGLCVNALGGQPGVYTADWAKPDAAAGMARIQRELGDTRDRSAFFVCVLTLCWPDGRHEYVEGRVNGTIAPAPRGAHGHGYDPLFIPEGHDRTFAEMTESEKNALSHRGRAVEALLNRFFRA
jgi:XTP/dITP diphosphohydrolase